MAVNLMYKNNDMRYIFFTGDDSELRKIEKEFNKIPSYMFMPSFRGIPKPEVFFHKFKSKTGQIIYYCHSGLWKTIHDWCQTKNIVIEYPNNFGVFKYTDFNLTLDEFSDYIESWEISLNPYPYQLKAAWLILKYRQSLSQLATRAGKTLIAYMIFRYMMEQMGAKKILMIVPAKALVKQAVGDFDEYAEFFQMETVWAGGELQEGANMTIGTFQSLVKKADKKSSKYDPHFFDDYDVVLVDEAHTLKCYSIDTILNMQFMKNVKLKFGFSGSLPDEHTIDSFCCHSLMGPMIQDIRSKELMDDGYLAVPHITQIRIEHVYTDELNKQYIRCGEYLNGIEGDDLPIEEREFTIVKQKTLPLVLRQMKENGVCDAEYRDYLIDLCKARGSNLLMLEQMLIHRDKKRLDLLNKLITDNDGNCIIFVHHTEYLNFVYKYIKENFPNKITYKISGSTTLNKRMNILDQMNKIDNGILIASYGVLSTGITLKKIKWGILFQSFKSQIINKQSLGRLMLKNCYKNEFNIYDFIDCFPTGRIKAQGDSKIKLYRNEGFDYKIKFF